MARIKINISSEEIDTVIKKHLAEKYPFLKDQEFEITFTVEGFTYMQVQAMAEVFDEE